jgi:hypothetical protein
LGAAALEPVMAAGPAKTLVDGHPMFEQTSSPRALVGPPALEIPGVTLRHFDVDRYSALVVTHLRHGANRP